MSRFYCWVVLFGLLAIVPTAEAATGSVIKVLPHFLDAEGRHTTSPSLYDRDAYQDMLRKNPQRRAGMRFDVHWKTKGAAYGQLKLVLEVRGVVEGKQPKQLVFHVDAEGGRKWTGKWTGIDLITSNYKYIGEVTAWRVSLWEGDQLLGEQKSFLW